MKVHSIHTFKKQAKKSTVSKETRNTRSILFLLIISLITGAFLVLAVLARYNNYFPFDLVITQSVQQIDIIWFDFTMRVLTILGNLLPVTLTTSITVLFFLVLGLRIEAFTTLFSVFGAMFWSTAFKFIVDRPRPSEDLINVVYPIYSGSFPSWHVLFFITLYGLLLFFTITIMKHSLLRTFLIVIFVLMILLIAPARIYAGHHWASDTIGSYLFGSVWLTVIIFLYRWCKVRFTKDEVFENKKR